MKSVVRFASLFALGAATVWANALTPEMAKSPVPEALPPARK